MSIKRTTALLILTNAVMACSQNQDIYRAIDTIEEKADVFSATNIPSYQWVFGYGSAVWGIETSYLISVREQKFETAIATGYEIRPEIQIGSNLPVTTLDDVFQFAIDELKSSMPNTVDFTFDPRYGYVRRVYIDPKRNVKDEELAIDAILVADGDEIYGGFHSEITCGEGFFSSYAGHWIRDQLWHYYLDNELVQVDSDSHSITVDFYSDGTLTVDSQALSEEYLSSTARARPISNWLVDSRFCPIEVTTSIQDFDEFNSGEIIFGDRSHLFWGQPGSFMQRFARAEP